MKKILLNETEKKAIISEREKAIISNFSKTFNSIKRIDENEVPKTPEMNEPQFDFVTSAIESASGDKIQKREEDDYGNPLYWSLTNRHIVYSIGGDNEDDIILYNGETGERYPIGNLKHYK